MRFSLRLGRFYKEDVILQHEEVLDLLNDFADENYILKWTLGNIFDTIIDLDFAKELYFSALMRILDEKGSVEETKAYIKEYLK